MSKSTYKYDKNNNQTEACEYNSDGLLTEKHTYKYDKNNNKIEWYEYDSAGLLVYKFTAEYDKYNNQTEECGAYYLNGLVVGKDNDQTEEGIIFTKCWVSRFEGKTMRKFIYDNEENWIERTTFQDGTPTFITERVIEYY